MHSRLPLERDPEVPRQPAGERRDRIARLNPQLVRAPQHRPQPGRVKLGTALQRCSRRKQLAAFGRVRAHKRIEQRCGFGAPGGDPQALMYDRDAGLLRDLLPQLPRAACPAPHSVAILAGNSD